MSAVVKPNAHQAAREVDRLLASLKEAVLDLTSAGMPTELAFTLIRQKVIEFSSAFEAQHYKRGRRRYPGELSRRSAESLVRLAYHEGEWLKQLGNCRH